MAGSGRHGRNIIMRLSALAVAIVAVIAAYSGQAHAQIGSDRYSSIVVDAATGTVLEAANPDALRHPASLTKLMTLYMVFEALRDRRVGVEPYVAVSPHAAPLEPPRPGARPRPPPPGGEGTPGRGAPTAHDGCA